MKLRWSALSSIALLTSFITFAAACGDDTQSDGGGGDQGGSGGSGAAGAAGGGDEGGGGGASAEPLDTTPGEWTFVDFPDAICMDGSATGIGVNRHPTSQNVVIFLAGGNACFNLGSCAVVAHKDGYTSATFDTDDRPFLESSDYFDRENADNPFKDYSYVFVPYCTGDIHGGSNDDVKIGPTTYQFHGYDNMTQYLERIVATFPDAESVVLTGVSAGGFGAAYNYDHVATAFGSDVRVTLIDDSGPPMSEEFVPACLQTRFTEMWNLAATLPPDCEACGEGGTFTEEFSAHMLTKYPDRSIGVISTEADATIRNFWGFGEDDCASIDSVPAAYPPEKYEAGLVDLRDRIGADGNFALFLIPGEEHVLLDNGLGAVSVGGVALEDWIAGAIAEDDTWDSVSTPE